MKLRELYEGRPASEHENILIAGDRVFVRTPKGTLEYRLSPDGELQLLRSEAEMLERLRASLGV